MPLHDLPLQTTLPYQLNQPDPVPALLGLDRNLGLAPDRVPQVLVVPQPMPLQGRVVADPHVDIGFVLLVVFVEGLALGGEHAVQALWFVAELRV
jgi:hypothetical protein